MRTETNEAAALFALRFSSDLLTALVLRGVLSAADANALIDASLDAALL
jgi:hypothetical protein